ncbi:hypothetical protein NQZ79_g8530 [Umbelopsis isabellina]|nr:hypothetical protein NQZ79_g8530 [Umbelopsis isabellina]
MQLVHVKAASWLWIIWLITFTLAEDHSQDCDCGFVNSNGLFTDYWYTDFSSYQGDIQWDPSFFVGNYSIDAKYPGTYARSFRSDNVLVTNNSLQLLVSVGDSVECASVGTKRQDMLYGSFRVWIKSTNIAGTVAAFFLFSNESEIDVELLSAVEPPQTYFAIHPGIVDPSSGRASSLTHTNYMMAYPPSQEFHEYRFDWMPNQAIFYIDGQQVNNLYTNIPSTPGRIMLNHWTDGNKNFSEGPPAQNAVMEIKNMTLFFNATTETGPEMKCAIMQTACNIDDIVRGFTPSASTPPAPISTVASLGISAFTPQAEMVIGILCVAIFTFTPYVW